MRFVDTLRFLPSRLFYLVNNLPKELLSETKKQFSKQNQFDLINRKGVFLYSYITSSKVLEETQLPSKEAFFNDITPEDIADADYQHARNVWSSFNIRNLGEYSDLYLLTDVMLLADVFENLRDMCLREYSLFPAYYITLPSFTRDVMLKITGMVLDTIQECNMFLFFENGIRGGITQCCHRHAQANNKHCEGYDSTKPSQYISYLDANNLYGWSMSLYLSSGGFKWLSDQDINNLDTIKLPSDGNIGYVFEVDLTYPTSLHKAHQSLPFCCESSIPPTGQFSKLLTTLKDKTNYICHFRTLQQALENGIEITKFPRVLSFNQSPWLKSYIDQNTQVRKSARNEFEKGLFKLMNNAVYG